ncbi:hypothetical protein M422DRAFT_55475 [Sphaerobolus stellatus SS14]|uniref:Uncharacterized protein n=1 Tax=Sphaerobolus stellatus (strain SS14) TaxID=990650 RepID=A0A0C9UM41_SPHS4|nr:hypothetical protein M422DRAFT_55475 [Sphaerobolus stellatus SS14]
MDNITSCTSLFDYLHNTSNPSWAGKTKAWLEDQGKVRSKTSTQETLEWLWRQYFKEVDASEARHKEKEKEAERKWWEATARNVDKQAKQWMAQAETQRQAALREMEKTRQIQEEVRRVKEKADAREAEWRRAREEEKIMSDHEGRYQKRRKRENAAKKLSDAWSRYERQWQELNTTSGQGLTFRTIPWPQINTPSSPLSISAANISFFLLSPIHSGGKSKRERIREAMQRWHNDKFEPRVLPRVIERDRAAVKEGVDIVVRCLNHLLSQESA